MRNEGIFAYILDTGLTGIARDGSLGLMGFWDHRHCGPYLPVTLWLLIGCFGFPSCGRCAAC